jgi:hypothetical protein
MLPIFPPFAELTLQVTLEFVTPFRVAANWYVPPAGTMADVGVMARPKTGEIVRTAVLDVIVVVEVEPEAVCVAIAVMSTSPLFVVGTTEGAVYTPTSLSVLDEAIVPSAALPPLIPFTCQVTVVVVEVVPLLRLTVAVKSVCALSRTLAVVGVIDTDEMVALPLPPQDARIMKPAIAAATTPKFPNFRHVACLELAPRRRLRSLVELERAFLVNECW